MRKGLTLSLAAASLLTATASFAYGPTIAGVPDVYIAKKTTSGADAFSNVYRFEDAIKLMDYITPGVTSGNGSTSATLYFGYGIRATVGSGAYLAPASAASTILYKIGSPAGSAITPIQVNAAYTTPATLAWKNEINVTNAASLQQISTHGKLSFYNVALSPLPIIASAGSDPYTTTLGAARQATIYVTDLSTTPGLASLLVVTTGVSTDFDTLSGGGALCASEVNYTSTSGFSNFLLGTDWGSPGAGIVTGLSTFMTFSNSGTALTLNTGLAPSIPSGAGLYNQYGAAGVSLNTSKVYRFKASLTTSNTAGSTANPMVIVQLADTVNTGIGYYQSVGSQFSTLTGPTAKCAPGYLWPTANGSASPQIIVFDSSATEGATITASSLRVDSFNPAALIGASVLYDAGTGSAGSVNFNAVTTATNGSWFIPSTGNFGIFNFPSGTTAAGFSVSPSAAGSAANLAINTGSSAGATSIQGIASWDGTNLVTPAANRLIVVKAKISTTNTANKYPEPWLIASGASPAFGSAGLIAPTNANTGNAVVLSTTGSDLNLVFDSFGAVATTVTVRAFATYSNTGVPITMNGDLTVKRLTVTQYTAPACICP